ncbi:MAG: transposase [Solirubrobacteraceae bacterium]
MAQNFIGCDREQAFLMPPSLREWLPEDHLAWCVLEAVGEMDLAALYGAYRGDGHGRPAYEPAMMVALVLFAFATKQRSSRAIERHCRQDVAYRVIAANRVPDHATIARFIERHERALAELFGQVLSLCARAGLVKVGVIAIDGTRLAANASPEANCDYGRIAREIVAEARATDEAEDELYGDARGDELPEHLRTPEGRRKALAEAKRALELEREAEQRAAEASSEGSVKAMEAVVRTGGHQGRVGWLREGRRELERRRAGEPEAIPRSRVERLALGERRLADELESDRRWNEAYEYYRAHARDARGRGLGMPPKAYRPPSEPEGKVNLTDPDSKQIKTNNGHGWVQGYNAQAVANEHQIVLAAEVTNNTADFGQLAPMVEATLAELNNAGADERPQVAVADAGFWNQQHIDKVVAELHVQVLIPPDAGNRKTPRPGWSGGRFDWMRTVLATDRGRELYRQRKKTIEPIFGHTKHNRGIRRFHRRGRSAVRTEWRLLMATHNLIKLHSAQLTAKTA